MRILIVEDEKDIALPLKKSFEEEGFAVDVSLTGKEGLEMANVSMYDCIILDLNLPEIDGIEITEKLREIGNTTPILMLTARGTQKDKLIGFESGADDYLVKPFNLRELILRVKSIIKRNSSNKEAVLKAKNITLNSLDDIVKINDKIIKLNKKEFGILEYLLRNKGRFISTEELLEKVWDDNVNIFTQTVRTNIKTLRQKVDPKKQIIITERGNGYAIIK